MSRAITYSKFHAVMKVAPDSDNPALVSAGWPQFLHRDIVDAIGSAVATAIGMRGHHDRLLGT